MKTCPHCERLIPDDAKICGFCGEKFNVNPANIEPPVAVVPPTEPEVAQIVEEEQATRIAEEQPAATVVEEQATRIAEEQPAATVVEDMQATRIVEEPQPAPVTEEPQVAPRPVYNEPVNPPDEPPKKSNRNLIIGLISALVALLIGGGVTWLITNDKLHFGKGADASSLVPEADDEFEKEDKTDFTRHEREEYGYDYDTTDYVIEEPIEDDGPAYDDGMVEDYLGRVRVTGVNVRLRSTPRISDYNILTDSRGKNLHPYKGQILTCIDEEGDFYYVYFNDMPCYISKQFAVFIDE
ncbi:MAG: hypothetical protein II905_05725 [Muribaculaceae bacterium]|nr:hypothetical protein [Muribaculaceae bacterium]